ncbi:hypothetical protein EV193_11344 [Herbihabitans rhizosphaerae]|uniref:site-specific DNA-methyltransferase (adenine-specific) n=1 Tax=Herbihabitans rhizosphaerae TaxID=1872711 RepID=A0A4Q7KEA2_9PSEU|nr:DNA methyltransferase [Herbihabitans rhizosphaerae]RZS32203.1 hypothetical protein EV193_11344 [Herbihabitans rhizosphaerae]
MAPRTAQRSRPPTVAEQHAEWLGLLRPEGPFLALPILTDAFPQGLDTVPDETRSRVRQAWTEVSADPGPLGPAWQDLILSEVLRFPPSALRTGASLAAEFPGLRPDAVVDGPSDAPQPTRLHVYQREADDPLIAAVDGQPALAEQVAQMCRDTRVPLALLTNGRLWVLVHARPGEATSVASFDADLWSEEPVLLRVFASLCCAPRVLRPDGNLAELFARSAEEHAHVTTTLGGQVREAVELFVAELARLDREAGGALLADVSERDIYRAALTSLMRLVFLLFADEQRLLPITDPVYANGYAVSTLYEQLEAERGLYGDEVGDRRAAAWPRLLALFGAIHAGCEHPDLRIPAHGGSLFDPASYPWLADAAITDRVVRAVLHALLVLRHKGKAAERLSYARLGVEQIGHVYEGLLEYSCLKVDEPFVGLRVKTKPELPLTELETIAGQGEPAVIEWLTTTWKATENQARKWLAATPDLKQRGDLHAACDNDDALTERVLPFWGLLRDDLRGAPTVFPARSVLFTQVGDRRATGTHYTPRELAEEIVRHTLAPLCFAPGPAQGAEPTNWRAKKADELLELKVVDPAMGSGAFLVAACRYLADRVVEAWDRDGVPSDVSALVGAGDDREGLLLAARRLVAARCIYGVDRDDMAVELAKLSMWLVTLAKDKPFGFLDHALRCGDSLIGLLSSDQLAAFHLDPKMGLAGGSNLFRNLHDKIEMIMSDVTDMRLQIESSVVQDARQAEEKSDLLDTAEFMTAKLRLTADAIVGAALSTVVRHLADEESVDFDTRLDGIADQINDYLRAEDNALEPQLRDEITAWLQGTRPTAIRPLHWPLEFPEVMNRGGFDAVVGNPPFIGGTLISGAVGKDVSSYLSSTILAGETAGGRGDLCAYFLRRNIDIAAGGRIGIIAKKTITEGDTREIGLERTSTAGWCPYRAVSSQRWTGTANIYVSLVWVSRRIGESEKLVLDGSPVRGISPSLEVESSTSIRKPHRLDENSDLSFEGCKPLGMGFILESSLAQELLRKDRRNRDVIFPYLTGEDLNSRPDCSATRWIINFHDWSIDQSRGYPEVLSIVEKLVKPEREEKNPLTYVGLMDRWWQYWRVRGEMLAAISGLDQVIVASLVTKYFTPEIVTRDQVLSNKLVVFSMSTGSELCLLSSGVNQLWAHAYSSSLGVTLNYSPSDAFETFAQPLELTGRMDRVGEKLHEFRRGVMLGRQLGLTKLYNLVHDPAVTDDDIVRLREIHVEVDLATAEAYGWDDLDLGHGFHETRQGRRFTVSPEARDELLDRLLELNHERYAEEVAKGLHTKKKSPAKRSRKAAPPSDEGMLF